MSRKKLICKLPPPRRPSGKRGALDDRDVVEILRGVATRYQTAAPQIFYPLRDAARQLRSPVTVISRAYKELQREGLLGTIRASRTLLEGRKATRKVNLRGFIGLPAPYFCFLAFQDYRKFYFAVRREAARQGFVTNLMFYQDNPAGREELVNTVHELGVDHVVWLRPRLVVQDIILQLRDKGLRIVGVADGRAAGTPCEFEIRRENALVEVLRRWRGDAAVSRVAVLRRERRSEGDEDVIEHAIEKAGLPFEYADLGLDGFEEVVRLLGKDRGTGLVLRGEIAALCSLRAPKALGEMLRTHRVVLPDGPISAIIDDLPPAPVDVITVDWARLARRIVRNLTNEGPLKHIPTLISAKPLFGVPLRDFILAA